MLCANWVCAGTLVHHEWVSESTISPHVEEILGMELDHGFDVPCLVQWSLLWFSAPTRLNEILGQDLKIKKYHEVVDKAITEAILRPFGGEHTPRSCMLTSVAKILHRTFRKWRVNKEMEGWMMRESLEPSSSGDDDEDECGDD